MLSKQLTSHLTGATVKQLTSWSGTGVLKPEFGRDGYSFRDIVALRTYVKLHMEVSLPKTRVAFNEFENRDLTENPSTYELTTDGDSVFLVEINVARFSYNRGHPNAL